MWCEPVIRLLRKFATSRRGNTTVLFAFSLPVLIGTAGLGVEAGYWQFQQRQLQTIADLSAYAGAVSLRNHESESNAHHEAEAEALLHDMDISRSTFSSASPPQSGNFVNDRSMEVVITHTLPRLFSQIFNSTPVTFEVRAVATYEEEADACVLALSHDEGAAINFFGSSNIQLLECEVMSNSIADDAVLVSGSTDISAPCINSVGGFAVNGGGSDVDLTACSAPRTNLPRALDPYADVDPPTLPTSCSNIPGGGGPHTVSPGASGVKRFCNGLSINSEVHFEPGVYVIDGGTFRLNANGAIYGEGVTFYLTDGAETHFNGNATVNLSAPTSGDFAGIVFFGDRDDTGADHTFNGTADSRITGAIYTPASDISFLGDFSGDNGCMQLVGYTVAVGGNANITTDCSNAGIEWASVPSDVRLVE